MRSEVRRERLCASRLNFGNQLQREVFPSRRFDWLNPSRHLPVGKGRDALAEKGRLLHNASSRRVRFGGAAVRGAFVFQHGRVPLLVKVLPLIFHVNQTDVPKLLASMSWYSRLKRVLFSARRDRLRVVFGVRGVCSKSF